MSNQSTWIDCGFESVVTSHELTRQREIVKGGFWERLLVLWHFCGVPRVLCKIEKSEDYNFTINSIDLERIS